MKTIWFDMDGTIANFYGVDNWLDYLKAENTHPYEVCKPMFTKRTMNGIINGLREKGYAIGIISYVSHNATSDYASRIAIVKNNWLKENFPAVDIIHICTKDTPKSAFYNHGDYLVDDEDKNLEDWKNAGGHTVKASGRKMLKALRNIV